MDVSWSPGAFLHASEAVGSRVAEDEANTMFAGDTIPPGITWSPVDLQTVQLPCGLELDFEVMNDGWIHIQWAALSQD